MFNDTQARYSSTNMFYPRILLTLPSLCSYLLCPPILISLHISDPENPDVGHLNTVGFYTFLKLFYFIKQGDNEFIN